MKKFCISLVAMLLFASVNFLYAQSAAISGKVTSAEDGLPIAGVSVYIKGTTIGVSTDAQGSYSLLVPNYAKKIVFSFVGYKTQEIAAIAGASIDVVLEFDVLSLEDIIVSGVAGATPKRKLSVTIDQVSSEDLQAVPATSASSALLGKITGITIVQPSGNPGLGSSIRLRGSTSLLGDSNPLIIVDGVMIEGDLADINVDDIENIEVVKGAAASALYGSRAGAGVIVVTTKRGDTMAKGESSVRVRNEFGMSQLPKKIDLANHHIYQLADDWQDYSTFSKYEGVSYPADYVQGRNAQISGKRLVTHAGFADQPYSRLFDQQDMIFQDGTYYTNYVGVAHNTGSTSIFSSFENTANSGIVWNTEGSQRQNFRLNVDHMIGEKISLKSSTFISQNKMDVADARFTGGWGGGQGTAFFNALFFEPDIDLNQDALSSATLPKYAIHPTPWQPDNGNPLHALFYAKRNFERKNVMQNFKATWFATSWLNFDGSYSFERSNYLRTEYKPKGFSNSQQINTDGGLYKYSGEGLSQVYSFTANMNKVVGALTLKGKLSYLYEGYESSGFEIDASGFTISGIPHLGAIRSDSYNTIYSDLIETRARNFFAIIDGDIKDRYIFSVLFRYDGSSLFGENNRWNPYYRASGAYRFSEDVDIPGIQELKIRGAYGTSGQRPGFSYQYETYSLYQGNPTLQTLGNKDLKPSETSELEVGLNIEFLNAFTLEATYAEALTEGAFYNVPVSAVIGLPYQWRNAADIESKSYEVSLGINIVKNRNFIWNTKFNFDKIQQVITKLNAPPFRVGPQINELPVFYVREGEVFGMMYGGDWVRTLKQMGMQLPSNDDINNYVVNSDGYVIKRGTEGTMLETPIKLLDKDGKVAFGKIADMNPDFNISWINTISVKGLTFYMLWQLKKGGDVYNQTKQWLYRDNRHGDIDQFGKPDNQKKATAYYQEFYRANDINSYFVEDGSFIKLREASLFYTINKQQLSRVGMNFLGGIKFGAIARNLLTFTNYSGWDPEVAQADYSNSTNYYIDMFNYPNYRMYTFSLELIF
ncbi:MAG: SusC/RagA family TonB-linked outer membrane protein [Bacteroidales bacterium]